MLLLLETPPGCSARSVQLPEPRITTLRADTEQIEGVKEFKVMGSPELADTAALKDRLAAYAWDPGWIKVIS